MNSRSKAIEIQDSVSKAINFVIGLGGIQRIDGTLDVQTTETGLDNSPALRLVVYNNEVQILNIAPNTSPSNSIKDSRSNSVTSSQSYNSPGVETATGYESSANGTPGGSKRRRKSSHPTRFTSTSPESCGDDIEGVLDLTCRPSCSLETPMKKMRMAEEEINGMPSEDEPARRQLFPPEFFANPLVQQNLIASLVTRMVSASQPTLATPPLPLNSCFLDDNQRQRHPSPPLTFNSGRGFSPKGAGSRGPSSTGKVTHRRAAPLTPRKTPISRHFPCNQCSEVFTSLASLSTHTTDAHGSYRCHICNIQFTQRSNLQRHALKHVGFKPFRCLVCNRTYNRKDHLTRHVEQSHPGHDPRQNIEVLLSSSQSLQYLSGSHPHSPTAEEQFVCSPEHGTGASCAEDDAEEAGEAIHVVDPAEEGDQVVDIPSQEDDTLVDLPPEDGDLVIDIVA